MFLLKLKNSILDLIFPKKCVNCNSYGEYLCEKCIKFIEYLDFLRCPFCKRKDLEGKFCNNTCSDGFYFDQLITFLNYKKGSVLQKIIIQFKYKFSLEIKDILEKVLIDKMKVLKDFLTPDFILIPVPIHKIKFKKRGFNQAKILADLFAEELKIGKNVLNCLIQKEYRGKQANLKREKRLQNLKNSIFLNEKYKNLIKGKNIILVDDIATTLSTLNECSKVLKFYEAKHICGLVLARSY